MKLLFASDSFRGSLSSEKTAALLKKAAKYYLSTNQLELYLITENNRITVGKIICNNPLIGISLSEAESIKQELNYISEYSLYANSYYSAC